MHCIRSFLVVLFLEYFFRQNKFPVFLTYLKMSNLAKKKKNGQKYHYSIQQKVEVLNFHAKYCERTRKTISCRKLAPLIEKELGYCVSFQTLAGWLKDAEKIKKSYSMSHSSVRVRDNEVKEFEDYLDSEFQEQMLKCSLTQG